LAGVPIVPTDQARVGKHAGNIDNGPWCAAGYVGQDAKPEILGGKNSLMNEKSHTSLLSLAVVWLNPPFPEATGSGDDMGVDKVLCPITCIGEFQLPLSRVVCRPEPVGDFGLIHA